MSDTVRVFVAVPLDDGIRTRAAFLCSRLGEAGTPVKWVEHENFHITLLFLGDLAPDVVDAVGAVLRDVVPKEEPFELTFGGIGAFPNLNHPKILWVGIQDGADRLREIHAKLRDGVEKLGSVEIESRSYTPHLTLGRMRSGRNGRQLTEKVREIGGWSAGPMTVGEIVLMKSELTSDGPVYTPITRANPRPVS